MKSMKRMQQLTPRMKKLQEKYKKNKEKLNKEMMELYRKNKVNPLGGCLPMLLQIPCFLRFIAHFQVPLNCDMHLSSFGLVTCRNRTDWGLRPC